MTEQPDRRQLVCDWLTANGVDPNRVPLDADITISNYPTRQLLNVELYCLDVNGNKCLDERGQDAARERVSVPLLADPPAWWQPYRKPTREQLLTIVSAVNRLHRGVEHGGQVICAECSALDDKGSTDNAPVAHPCATVKALGQHAPARCPRCKGHKVVPDWSNWDDYHGEPRPKACPKCSGPVTVR